MIDMQMGALLLMETFCGEFEWCTMSSCSLICFTGATVPGLRDGLADEEDRNLELSRKSSHMETQGLVKRKEKGGRMLFGVEMSPDTIAIAMVYFVQGILGLSRLAVSFFLKDDLHLDPAEVSWFIMLSFHLRSDVHSSCFKLGCCSSTVLFMHSMFRIFLQFMCLMVYIFWGLY